MARLVRCPRRKTVRPRADYAAAAVLTGGATANTTCELAGDTAYTLGERAAEISRQRESDHRPRPKKPGHPHAPVENRGRLPPVQYQTGSPFL